MAKSNGRAQVEKHSPFAFRETLDLLSKAITDAGLTLFAVIDHARNASEAGLQMPPTTVLIYGKAEGGTPIMREHPQSALDLPLRALVREDADGKTILSFYPIAKALESFGVPASVGARLAPAQELLLKVLDH